MAATEHIADTLARLEGIIAPVVAREGFELFDLELKRAGGRKHLVRITIDVVGRESFPVRDKGGEQPAAVGIGDCVRVTKALGPVLDVEDVVPGAYTLEVSSPGVNRVLKAPKHFAMAVGHQVRVKTRTPIDGESFFIAPLVEADEDRFVLDVRGAQVQVPYRLVSRANLEVEL